MGGQSQKGPEMDGEDWPAAAAGHQQIATAAEISIIEMATTMGSHIAVCNFV